jgi:hypothetical protein
VQWCKSNNGAIVEKVQWCNSKKRNGPEKNKKEEEEEDNYYYKNGACSFLLPTNN